jgi:predicted GH43/DUF377 family glycosyl hydrolase
MLFSKSKQPILSPYAGLNWANGAIFNPGAWYEDGKIHLLFRAIPSGYKRIKLNGKAEGEPEYGFSDDYISYIGYAISENGIDFEINETPFIAPNSTSFNKFGAEDPRISKIDDDYLITYTALSKPAFDPNDGVRIGLATTKDFKTIENHGISGPPNKRDKDAIIFPKRINGKIGMIHRINPNMQLIWFDSMEELCNPPAEKWEKHLANIDDHAFMKPKFEWENLKIGGGPTPIETEHGWLIIYHGVNENHEYRTGLALLDLDDPSKVIARVPYPVMEPTQDFELKGDVPNVVFPEGAVVIDGTLHVYYGAADLVIGHASAPLKEVLDLLLTHKG